MLVVFVHFLNHEIHAVLELSLTCPAVATWITEDRVAILVLVDAFGVELMTTMEPMGEILVSSTTTNNFQCPIPQHSVVEACSHAKLPLFQTELQILVVVIGDNQGIRMSHLKHILSCGESQLMHLSMRMSSTCFATSVPSNLLSRVRRYKISLIIASTIFMASFTCELDAECSYDNPLGIYLLHMRNWITHVLYRPPTGCLNTQ